MQTFPTTTTSHLRHSTGKKTMLKCNVLDSEVSTNCCHLQNETTVVYGVFWTAHHFEILQGVMEQESNRRELLDKELQATGGTTPSRDLARTVYSKHSTCYQIKWIYNECDVIGEKTRNHKVIGAQVQNSVNDK